MFRDDCDAELLVPGQKKGGCEPRDSSSVICQLWPWVLKALEAAYPTTTMFVMIID